MLPEWIANVLRAETDSPATDNLPITMRLAEPPTLHELARSA